MRFQGRGEYKPQLTTRQRRQMIHWHVAHGANIPATCAQFGVSRATLYRWLPTTRLTRTSLSAPAHAAAYPPQ